MWTEERTTFKGKYFQLKNAPFQPKPLQMPHPPIVIGGGGEKRTLPMVARMADEWNWNMNGTIQDYRRRLKVLEEHCNILGRDPHTLDLSLNVDFLISEDPNRIASALKVNTQITGISMESSKETVIVGNPDQVRRQLQIYIDMGVRSFIFSLRAPFEEAGTSKLPDLEERTLRYSTTMDDVRRLAQEVLPPLLHHQIC